MRRANISAVATITLLAVVAISVACAVSCYGPEAFMPPCHQQSHSCGPLFRTAVSPHAAAILLPALAMALTAVNPVSAPALRPGVGVLHPAEHSPPGLDPPTVSILRI